MSLILNIEDWEELLQQPFKPGMNNLVSDDFEILEEVPEFWGP